MLIITCAKTAAGKQAPRTLIGRTDERPHMVVGAAKTVEPGHRRQPRQDGSRLRYRTSSILLSADVDITAVGDQLQLRPTSLISTNIERGGKGHRKRFNASTPTTPRVAPTHSVNQDTRSPMSPSSVCRRRRSRTGTRIVASNGLAHDPPAFIDRWHRVGQLLLWIVVVLPDRW